MMETILISMVVGVVCLALGFILGCIYIQTAIKNELLLELDNLIERNEMTCEATNGTGTTEQPRYGDSGTC